MFCLVARKVALCVVASPNPLRKRNERLWDIQILGEVEARILHEKVLTN